MQRTVEPAHILETMQIRFINGGHTALINKSDFNPNLHEVIADEAGQPPADAGDSETESVETEPRKVRRRKPREE